MAITEKQKQILILVLFFIVVVALWNTFFIYPIKLFVVILHEMSHGLMAVLFGGSIVEIQIDSRIGGYCKYIISGGKTAEFFIASAGYLGSLIWGGIILILAIRTNIDRYISLIIGIIVLILSFFVIKTGQLFGIVYCFAFSAMMILSYKFLPNVFHDYMLKFIGITSCLYAVIDIKSDLIDRSSIGSDADAIANLTGIPSIVVGISWLIISFVILFFILKYAFKGPIPTDETKDQKN